MNPKKNGRPATSTQESTLGNSVGLAVTKAIGGKLTFDQAQIAITDPEQFAVNALAMKFVKEIFEIPSDPWFEKKKRISIFYNTCFKDKRWHNPTFKDVQLPKGSSSFKELRFVFAEMTFKELREAYFDYFRGKKMPKYWDKKDESSYCNNIAEETIPQRPLSNYFFLHKDGPPDVPETISKEKLRKMNTMSPKEAMIAEFQYRFETGKSYDEYNATLVNALSFELVKDTGGLALSNGKKIPFSPPEYESGIEGVRKVPYKVYLFGIDKLGMLFYSLSENDDVSSRYTSSGRVTSPALDPNPEWHRNLHSTAIPERVFGYREIVLASF